MKVVIVNKPKTSTIWYFNHIGEVIDVVIENSISFPSETTYRVSGPEKLLKYYEDTCGYKYLGIEKCDVRKIRKKILKNILNE